MSTNITGSLIKIEKARQITDKFSVRNFAIQTNDKYPQKIKFQLTNDRCDLIDNHQIGDVVKVFYDLKGRENKEGVIYNNIEAWKIESDQEFPAPDPQTSSNTSIENDLYYPSEG